MAQDFIGHESGEIYSLDYQSGEVTYLCKPLRGHRIPGMDVRPDGMIVGVGGNDRDCMGFAVDPSTGKSEMLGELTDTQADVSCFRTHDCCLVDDVLYVGETDTPERSCYLWKCELG